MKKFKDQLQANAMVLVFHPMRKDYNYLIDFDKSEMPGFDERGKYLEVGEFEFIPEYKGIFTLQ